MSSHNSVQLRTPILDIIVLGARAEEKEALYDALDRASDREATISLRKRVESEYISFPVFNVRSKAQAHHGGPSHVSVGLLECSEMGNVSAAINTAFAISRLEPTLLIFSGIAGSLNGNKLRIGDVIMPKRVKTRYFQKLKTWSPEYASLTRWDKIETLEAIKGQLIAYDHSVDVSDGAKKILGYVRSSELESYLDDIDIPEEWTSKYNVAARRTKCILEEEIFSWDKVLSNKDYVDFLKSKISGAWTTVDMESYGYLRAVEKLRSSKFRSHGIVIRSVSDFAEHKELSDSDSKWRKLGLRNMASATLYIVESVFGRGGF